MCLLEKLEDAVRDDALKTVKEEGLTENANEKINTLGSIRLAKYLKNRKASTKVRLAAKRKNKKS